MCAKDPRHICTLQLYVCARSVCVLVPSASLEAMSHEASSFMLLLDALSLCCTYIILSIHRSDCIANVAIRHSAFTVTDFVCLIDKHQTENKRKKTNHVLVKSKRDRKRTSPQSQSLLGVNMIPHSTRASADPNDIETLDYRDAIRHHYLYIYNQISRIRSLAFPAAYQVPSRVRAKHPWT